jgi:hypothetical protein
MIEATVENCNAKQYPSADFKRITTEEVIIRKKMYEQLAFVKMVSTDSYIVIRNAIITNISYGYDRMLQVRGIDITDGIEVDLANPCDVQLLPVPWYINK